MRKQASCFICRRPSDSFWVIQRPNPEGRRIGIGIPSPSFHRRSRAFPKSSPTPEDCASGQRRPAFAETSVTGGTAPAGYDGTYRIRQNIRHVRRKDQRRTTTPSKTDTEASNRLEVAQAGKNLRRHEAAPHPRMNGNRKLSNDGWRREAPCEYVPGQMPQSQSVRVQILD